MSTFEVKVYKAKVLPHPNADRLDLIQIGDYLSASRKGDIKDGDTVAYIPEKSIVPESLLEEIGLKGNLAGSNKDRVKASKIRDVVSQGLVYKMDEPVGTDVKDKLGIIEYVPYIPSHMNGDVWDASPWTIKYDIENIKRYPDTLIANENVVVTEKLHGTWCCIGYHMGTPIVSSKGLSMKGLSLKLNENNLSNVYVRTFREYENYLKTIHNGLDFNVFYVLGEVHGKGIQKKYYYGSAFPIFRVFDVYVGTPLDGRFLSWDEMHHPRFDGFGKVPLLYRGGYDKEKITALKDGDSTVPNTAHIREGIVIKSDPDRRDEMLGRVILKSVSDAHLTKQGGTEYE